MNKLKKIVVAVAAATPMLYGAGAAQASPVFAFGYNQIYFTNAENIYRLATACDAANPCYAYDAANDPTDKNGNVWRRADNTAAGNVKVGDVFAGILNVQNIDGSAGTVWAQNIANDQFSGYFAQQVEQVLLPDPYPGAPGVPSSHLGLTTVSVDPWSILNTAKKAMFALWTDTGAAGNADASAFSAFTLSGTIPSTIAKATNGSYFGSLGPGVYTPATAVDVDGYGYDHVDLTQTIANTTAKGFYGLDFVEEGVAYNLKLLVKINDNNENEVGGVATNPSTGTCLSFGPAACNDVFGQASITINPRSALAGSPIGQLWDFQSNDPFNLYQIPEPGSLALLGLAFGVLGVARRRKQ